jgi:hypothetical protein
MAPKPKVRKKDAAALIPLLKPRGRPRGRAFPKGYTGGFAKGQSGNPGGKPKVIQKFSAMVAEELMQPCPTELLKPLGLERGASMHAAMVRAQVMLAAQGDTTAFAVVRETIEGKLPQVTRNLNVTVAMQRYLEDENFRAFLDHNHDEYLKTAGGDFNADTRGTFGTDVPELPAGDNAGRIPQD